MLTYSRFKSAGRKATSVAASLQKKEYGSAPTIQTKLTIGKPNDKYEQEADRVADQVVSSPPTQGPSVQKKCADCDKEDKAQMKPILQKMEEDEVQTSAFPSLMKMEEEEPQAKLQLMEEEEPQAKLQLMQDEEVQTKTGDAASPTVSPNIGNQIQKSKGGGSPLPGTTRSFMESRIGADFSKVRVHNDDNAHKLSAQLNAQAFALGNNVFFNKGKYNPGTRSGQHLLAHELTHVVQQKGRIQPRVQRQNKPGKVNSTASPNKVQTTVDEATIIKIVAIAMAEAHSGQETSIASVYLNLYKGHQETGLKKSAAYTNKSDNYKLYLTVLGNTTYANDKPKEQWLTVMDSSTKTERGAKTIQEYINGNGFFQNVTRGESRAKALKAIVDGWVSDPATQPNKGWTGQGNLNDINNISNSDVYWTRARAYFWVQKSDPAAAKYLEVLPAREKTQFIFNSKSIQMYYRENELPSTVKKITVNDL